MEKLGVVLERLKSPTSEAKFNQRSWTFWGVRGREIGPLEVVSKIPREQQGVIDPGE